MGSRRVEATYTHRPASRTRRRPTRDKQRSDPRAGPGVKYQGGVLPLGGRLPSKSSSDWRLGPTSGSNTRGGEPIDAISR